MAEFDSVDLRQLRYIVETAKAQSITAAAGMLGISQPALTRNILNVEQQLDLQIFHRLPRGVALSEEGEEFVNRAKIILENVDALNTDVKNAGAGRLRIGFAPAGFSASVTDVMAEYAEKYPEVTIDTVTGSPQSICPRLVRGEIDVVIGSSSYLELWPELALTKMEALEFACVMRGDHPLVSRNDVSVSAVLEYPLVLPESVDPVYTDLASIYMDHGYGGVKPRYVTDDFTLALSLIRSTDAFYPYTTSKEMLDFLSLEFHILRDVISIPTHYVSFAIAKNRTRPAAAKNFIDVLTANIH